MSDDRTLRSGADGDLMVEFDVVVSRGEIVYLKAVLEAHPGLAAVHAEPGRQLGAEVPLTIVTTRSLAGELEQVLDELGEEIPLVMRTHDRRSGESPGRGT